MSVRKLDFSSETPPPRIIGTETEYTPSCTADTILDAMAADPALPVSRLGRSYLVLNGGAVDTDGVSTKADKCLAEYSTPEALGGAQACLYEFSGHELLARFLAKNPGGIYKRGGYGFGEQHTTGYHENYLVSTNIVSDAAERYRFSAQVLIRSFLASRLLWAGSGCTSDSGYRLSQKAHHVTANDGELKSFLRFNLPCSGRRRWGRLEVRGGEPNMSSWVTSRRLAATSFMLRLLEQPSVEADDLAPLVLANSIKSYRQLSIQRQPNTLLNTADGKTITALDHQGAFLRAMLGLTANSEIPAEEVDTANDLLKLLEDMAGTDTNSADVLKIADRVEWAAKQYVLILKFGEEVLGDCEPSANVFATDLQWERIGGIGERWWAKRGAETPYSSDELELALTTPPSTRAREKMELIHHYGDRVLSYDWDQVEIPGSAIDLPSPYGNNLPRAA